MSARRRNTDLFVQILAALVVALIALHCLWPRNGVREQEQLGGARVVDTKAVTDYIEQGELTDREALFYTPVEPSGKPSGTPAAPEMSGH